MSAKYFTICASLMFVAIYVGAQWLDAPVAQPQTTPAELTEFDKQAQLARERCKEPAEQLFSWKFSTDGKLLTCMPWVGKPYSVKLK